MDEVTLAGPDEWRTHREIRLAALADAPHAFESTLEQEVSLTETDWRRRLETAHTFHGSRDGKILATATGLTLADGDVHLVGVWADPSARGTGLAAAVVSAVLEWARSESRPRVWAWVVEDNVAAERLYLKLGFRRTDKRQPLPNNPARQEILLVSD